MPNETVEKVPKRHIWVHRILTYARIFTDCSEREKSPEKKATQEEKNLDMIRGLCYDTGELRAELLSLFCDMFLVCAVETLRTAGSADQGLA